MTQTSSRASAERRPVGFATRFLLAAALVGGMLGGILLLGRLASSDVMAMVLTTVFFGLLAGVLFLGIRRRRELWVPVGGAYVAVAATAGVILGLPLVTDDIVDEDVVVAGAASTEDRADVGAGQAAASAPAQAEAARQVASGQFEARDHPGEGIASLVDTPDGTVLTLTDFATDNGPDLLVYLVPPDAPAGTVEGFVDLGVLKGNIGDQQYDVPAEAQAGAGWRVVVWCRAFAVSFTEALLT
ncbi:MAG: DM13 domain-containing protein [Dermatophilaceae bacterium]